RLRRELGIPGAVGLGLSSIIGTGVFVSIGLGAQIAGPGGVLVAIAIACFTATCNALNSAQLAAAYPVSGGTYEYAYRLLHPLVGFTAGWTFLCAKTASGASAAVGFASYLLSLSDGHLFKPDPRNNPASPPAYSLLLTIGLGLIVCLTTIVALGIRLSNRTNWGILSVTLSSLVFFSIAGLAHAHKLANPWQSVTNPDRAPLLNILEASGIMFVAFTGYGRVATLGDDVRQPRVTIPKAIVTTLIISGALYILVGAAAVLAAGSVLDLAPTPGIAPLAVVAMRAFTSVPPSVSGTILALGAMAAMAGVLLNLVLGLSRMILAMARRGDAPPVFAKVHAGNGSPIPAVLLMGVLLVLTVVVTRGEVKLAWTFSAVTVLIYYAICNVAAVCMPEEKRRFSKAWGYAGTIVCLGLAAFIDATTWMYAGIVIGAGLLWHVV
ncbi:amino acid permease/ SLC12A domain-containing protein, partial [Catenaria anguillulae PL171]